ncbi:high affinity potassium transporter [Scheffersomyces coipomensis]|uniref:high affinity potassium transporter n=1 Tax=Scheffersomyces coipomensis TaxID=1788519 RepID=UPI00315D91EA
MSSFEPSNMEASSSSNPDEDLEDKEVTVSSSEDSIKSNKNENNHDPKKQTWKKVFILSFSSLGAIYGDLGTSPLYVLNSIKYKHTPPNKEDLYGGISLIFYLFTIIVIIKYICIVLFIGPINGEGGQVAIYAKIARYIKIGPKGVHIPGEPEVSDMELIKRQDSISPFMATSTGLSSRLKQIRDSPLVTKIIQVFILLNCFIGCSLVFSDGLLTPTTSVLSAIGGIKIADPTFDNVLAVSEIILVALFVIQQFGSNRISFLFAPIIFIWIIGLIICGIYNIAKHDPGIFKALSPYYAIKLLQNEGINVLGGAMLSITGTEAMFADIGHFGRLPIQITLTFFVYPALIICYLGQGAYVVKNPEAYVNPFFFSIPSGTSGVPFWIMFVLATLSTIIASQALILSVFSIVTQLIALDCFPKLRVVHTSMHHEGNVYIPTINWLLMIGVCLTTAGFQTSANVTSAFGLGITLDFLVTSLLIALCMFYVYSWNIIWPIIYLLFFLPLEFCLIIANMSKVIHGAWFPLMMTALNTIFLSVWRYGRSRKVNQEFATRVKIKDLYPNYVVSLDLGHRNNSQSDITQVVQPRAMDKIKTRNGETTLNRGEGIAIMYNDSSMQNMNSPNTVPLIYAKLIQNFSCIPAYFIFCSMRVLSIPHVEEDERVMISSMKIPGHYRCILRFGFMELEKIDQALIERIVSSIPESTQLARKYTISVNSVNAPPHPEVKNIPILHVFESNLIRSRIYGVEDKTKNPFKWIWRIIRQVIINYIFGPISSVTQGNGQFVNLETQEDESTKKIFIGGVSRI